MKLYLSLLFTLLGLSSISQQLNIKVLDAQNGLSNNQVVSIVQDKMGFIWIATEEGLNRFDGNDFRAFYKQSFPSLSLSGNELNKILDDRNDSIIWIATQRNGLNGFNYSTGEMLSFKNEEGNPNSLVTDDITDVINSSDGNLWIATYYGGIDYYDKTERKFIHYNSSTVKDFPNDPVLSITEIDGKYLFAGHASSGLSIMNIREKSVKTYSHIPGDRNSLSHNSVRSIYCDDNNNIWIGTDNGLCLFDQSTDSFRRFGCDGKIDYLPESVKIFDVRQIDKHNLWISTEFNGIYILDLKQLTVKRKEDVVFGNISYGETSYNISSSTVRDVFNDSFGNIWIGTYGGGVNFISCNPMPFRILTNKTDLEHNNNLSDKVAWGMCTDKSGRIWIGTDGGGINVYENNKRVAVFNKQNSLLKDLSILALYNDSSDRIWIGTFRGGVYIYDQSTGKIKPLQLDGFNGQDIRCFYEDAAKNMWVGTGNGVYRIAITDMQSQSVFTTYNSQLQDNNIRSITADHNGNLWIGSFGYGLVVFSPGMERRAEYHISNGFISNTVNHIVFDGDNSMMVATGDGLSVIDAASYDVTRLVQRSSGLENTHIRAISIDYERNIWMSTNKGISCVSPDLRISNYTSSQGIPKCNFMSGSTTTSHKGDIYFGSLDGVCSFPVGIVKNMSNPPLPTITGLVVYDKNNPAEGNNIPLNFGSENEFVTNYSNNSLTIKFNILDYSYSDVVEYSYKLEGLNQGWFTLKDNNSVTFMNLSPEKYELRIRSRCANQEWEQDYTSFYINVLPPLWLTWWAKVAYVLLFISVLATILYFYQVRIKWKNYYELEHKKHEQEQHLNDERLRLYTNIAHELRTPLTLVIGPLEDLSNDRDLDVSHRNKVALIQKSALRLLALINQLLEFRKTETQNKKLNVSRSDINSFIKEIVQKYKDLNSRSNLDIIIDVPEISCDIYFDNDVITMMMDNLIGNAQKYTNEGFIRVSVSTSNNEGNEYTEIKVSDSGIGISEEDINRIFERYYQVRDNHSAGTGIGLSLVKNLADLHNAEVWARSTPGEGSEFFIRLLTGNSYDKHETEAMAPENKDISRQILLVVEDDHDIREYIAGIFAKEFQIEMAVDGTQGLEKAMSIIPDVIISDIMMPGIDGLTLCKTIKDDLRTCHIPVILLTAKDDMTAKTDGYEAGADSYLTKPFSAGLLKSRLGNLIEGRKRLAAILADSTVLPDRPKAESNSLGKLDNEFLSMVNDLIMTQLESEKTDITYLSDKMCMSSSTLYRKMKALTGLSTNEYVRKVKMQSARSLLMDESLNVSDVAYRVGFSNPIYFRQCFKKEYGQSPSEFKQNCKGTGVS